MIKLLSLLTEAYSFNGPKKKIGEYGDSSIIYNFTNKKN